MNYQIRQAEEADLPKILQIYSVARRFMAEHGNESQWGNHYPSIQQTQRDIIRRELYVLTGGNRIHGVFAMIPGEDPTYCEISGGAWHYDLPYAAIHRVAGDGSGGIFAAIADHALGRYGYLRIDTHEDNLPMQKAVQRAGFRYCGIIVTEDGTPRLAFDQKK